MSDMGAELDSADNETVYDALIDAGKERRFELRERIERFLSSPVAFLREAAVRVLTFYWRLPEHETTAMNALQHDQDAAVRAVAAMGLSGYAKGESDVLRLLVARALDGDEDESVRDAAFSAALVVAGVDRADFPLGRTIPGFEQKANWSLLLRVLERCGAVPPERLRILGESSESVEAP